MNVSRLAHQLKLTPKELLIILPRVGFDIGGRAQKIPDSQVDKMISAVRKFQKVQEQKQREDQVREVREKKTRGGEAKKVTLPETVVVKDLADMLQLPVAKVMAEMMKNGIMASLNERLDFETASIISEDLGYAVTKSDDDAAETTDASTKKELQSLLSSRSNVVPRPPVVVVMGHVDHGKTKLLDAIRKTNIVAGESGGITQHIGAYQTEATAQDGSKRLVTFLDTPGHEAFKAMRSRGGQIADVAILVVAADDGLQPQTLESLSIIQKENLPFIVAINKIDKETADIEKVKKGLSEINLVPEDWGGKTVCVPISALAGKGIPELLEMVLLTADLEQLVADPSGNAIGTIIESHVDKGEGPVATVLIQAGTLKENDLLTVGDAVGKVKALRDWKGKSVDAATPGMPVKILGLKQLPRVGEILTATHDRDEYNKKLRELNKRAPARATTTVAKKEEEAEESNVPSLNLLIRADVLGSLEALEESILKLSSDAAAVRIIKRGLGFVTEADVLTAQATGAIMIAFHLKEKKNITALAAERGVEFIQLDVIYHVLENLKQRLESIRTPETVRELIGKLSVLAVFKTRGSTTVCGGKVTDGVIKKGNKVKILRGESVLGYAELANLQSNKENVSEAAAGSEAGLELTTDVAIAEGDVLECFVEKH